MNEFSLEYFLNLKSSWEYLKETKLPIFIYGMGDGALKILEQFENFDIPCCGIFASDEFVRGHYFEGHKVHKLTEIEDAVEHFVIVLAFAAGYNSLIEMIDDLAGRHPLIAPDVPVFGGGLFTKEYVRENFEKLEAVYNLLSDDFSKEAYSKIIEYKITGKIALLRDISTPQAEAFQSVLKLSNKEFYVDLGAYNGDTVLEFIEQTGGKYSNIIALEPDIKNFRKLSRTIKGHNNIEIFNVAGWGEDSTLTFDNKAGRHSTVSKSGTETTARSVDSILDGREATFIKYDVEGAESHALLGTAKTMENFKPKLAVALYHRNEDIFALPLLVKELNPDYKLIIRKAPYYPAWEINLFAL